MAAGSRIEEILQTKTRAYGPISDASPVLLRVKVMMFVEESKKILTEGGVIFSPNYVTTHLVTLLEAFLKASLAYLVDSGEPFRTNARGLISSWSGAGKQIADGILAIHQDLPSLGEIVAFTPSYSRIEDIIGTFDLVFGRDLKRSLEESRKYWLDDGKVYYNTLPLVISDIDKMISHLSNMLRVRHILVHEVPRSPPYKREDLFDFLESAMTFVDAMDCALQTKISGHPPRRKTEKDMITQLDNVKNELHELAVAIQGIEKQSLSNADIEQKFLAFCEAAASHHASNTKDGSPNKT
jgi:hypothetical protein